MKLYAMKFVRFDRIEDHYRQGWVMSFPNAPMHHHYYGVELAWICSCPIPGGCKPRLKAISNRTRVPEAIPANEAYHVERADRKAD